MAIPGFTKVKWKPVWIIIVAFISYAQSQCSEPEGVANAEILTSSPYNNGDMVTYRCLSGFTMTGTPSQLCSGGAWSGTAPSCALISTADIHEQDVQFTNDSGDSMVIGMGVLIGMVFLIMLTMLIIALCIICRKFRSRTPTNHKRKPKKVTIKQSPTNAQNPPSPTMSTRTPRMVDLVEQVMEERHSNYPPAKELEGWRPFAKPKRDINTSTQ